MTNPLAGQPLPKEQLVNVARLLDAYVNQVPNSELAEQRVSFGTSGHRGSSFHTSFNEYHVLAITQAICDYRSQADIRGPIFVGRDTHALSEPAQLSALEVLVANGVTVMVAARNDYTPTPAVSHAILSYNQGRSSGLADGIVITPSHNPPDNGGFKYNPPNGGPADSDITNWIQNRANQLLATGLREVKRLSPAQVSASALVVEHDYIEQYVSHLPSIIDLAAIAASGVSLGVDPLGGAGLNFWYAIAERHKLRLSVVNPMVDPQFAFMSADWDGKIRMDPSSQYTMRPLLKQAAAYDIVCACDADHDRHGIATASHGLLPPNHYLAVMVDYLFQSRAWHTQVAVGKTLVSSAMIDKVARRLGRPLLEVPVGFKWFAPGLFDGSLGFGGEESAGASFLCRDGSVWSTDKDGLIPCLLAAEMTAANGQNPGQRYEQLCAEFGRSYETRIDAPANSAQKKALAALSPERISSSELAGSPITQVLSKAPGNQAAIGGIKVESTQGWFAARPSGTEDIYKIYAESFVSPEHLTQLIGEAQSLVNGAIAGS
ncbi:MAG TPA: phosphoglucomutase (alpha-D-glucose-1,6-bisphosphate-dependent) [Cellvibrionaceae bacterium]|nr:phosphoglucomutase (alpha-D-glucose-1,6-bisphosphate-dependent) [Cellvibrionaceae bacterium]